MCINKQCVFTSLSKDVQAETRPRSPTNTLSPRRRCCGVGLSTSSLSLPLSFLNLTVFDLVKFRSILRPRAVSSRSCTCSRSRRRRPISRHLRPAPFGLSSSPSGCGAVATRDYGNLRVTRHFSGVVTHSALHSERIRIPWGGHFPDVGGIFQRQITKTVASKHDFLAQIVPKYFCGRGSHRFPRPPSWIWREGLRGREGRGVGKERWKRQKRKEGGN